MEGAKRSRQPSRGRLAGLWRSFRPNQWVKNVFVGAALVFSQHLTEPTMLGLTLAAFAVFCAVSSAVYLINDLVDRPNDRLHPLKKNRPIPSGLVPPEWAGWTAGLLLILGLGASAWIGPWFLAAVLAYAGLSLAYCFGLKRVVILDVMVLAA